jgi:tripartite-type tricarboxylate transporter receptor subunit TctC
LTFESIGGLFGPRGMSEQLRESIAADFRAVAADPAIAPRLGDIGTIMDIRGPAEFAAAVQEQRDRLAGLAKVLGLKASQ